MNEAKKPKEVKAVDRRKFLKAAIGLGAGAVTAGLVWNSVSDLFSKSGGPSEHQEVVTTAVQNPAIQPPEAVGDIDLDEIVSRLESGGPGKDGIPAIKNPVYVSAQEADRELSQDAIIFGIEYNGHVKAFPQNILNWHEIVDDDVDGELISVTYCPLTGSPVGYKGKSATGGQLSFGVSGKLYNSNLVMYDHQTDSLWPQILGIGINGPNKGVALEQFPIVLTTWRRWKSKHPETLVLSQNTGYPRDYSLNPYEGYEDTDRVWFSLTAKDNRYHPKKMFLGIRYAGEYLAVPKQEFSSRRIANTLMGGKPVVIMREEELDAIRAFSSRVAENDLTFSMNGEGISDDQTASLWTSTGECFEGKLANTRLTQLYSIDVMWFAWYAFHPGTKLLA